MGNHIYLISGENDDLQTIMWTLEQSITLITDAYYFETLCQHTTLW